MSDPCIENLKCEKTGEATPCDSCPYQQEQDMYKLVTQVTKEEAELIRLMEAA